MTGPIPVFSFVFAAYAATSREGAPTASAVVDLSPRTPFRTACRLQLARGGAFFAKVGFLSQPGGKRLAVGARGETGEEIWLSGIVESGLGFLGAPVQVRGRSQATAAGQPVRFYLINVLDWRIGACPDPSLPHQTSPVGRRSQRGARPKAPPPKRGSKASGADLRGGLHG